MTDLFHTLLLFYVFNYLLLILFDFYSPFLPFSEATVLLYLTCPLKVVLGKYVSSFDKWYGMSSLRTVFITFV